MNQQSTPSRHSICALLFCCLCWLPATGIQPIQAAPAHLDPSAPTEKRGEFRYAYRMLFNLYDVALYAAPHVSTDAILQAETSFSLEFQYLRTINKSTILTAAEKMLERNLSPAERALIAGKVAQLNEAYTTVHPGDCSALSFQPGLGTTLRINHQPVITIQGKRFAQLYFKIWLGEKPLSQRMKSVLLDI